MSSRRDNCFNSILARRDSPTFIDPRGRCIFKGTHVFTYSWDYTAGHFPQMSKLVKDSNYELRGFSSLKADAPESRQHLITVQRHCFGDDFPIVDVNALLKKTILDTREIFKFFVDHKNIQHFSSFVSW